MAYTMYTPLNVWLDPASVTDVVAYIQNYLSENTIYSEEEIETLIHDYLEAHPELIGGVQSVNGKTGTVVLTASDINTQNNVTIESVLSSLSSQISSIASSVATNTSNITNLTGRMTTAETDISNLKSSLPHNELAWMLKTGAFWNASGVKTESESGKCTDPIFVPAGWHLVVSVGIGTSAASITEVTSSDAFVSTVVIGSCMNYDVCTTSDKYFSISKAGQNDWVPTSICLFKDYDAIDRGKTYNLDETPIRAAIARSSGVIEPSTGAFLSEFKINAGETINANCKGSSGVFTIKVVYNDGSVDSVAGSSSSAFRDYTLRAKYDGTAYVCTLKQASDAVGGTLNIIPYSDSDAVNILKRVVCIGDSYTTGYTVDTDGNAYQENEEFSWPHYMSNRTGNEWLNCGASGVSTKTWLTNARGLNRAKFFGTAQAYVIGLMINDSSDTDRHVDVGTDADIGTSADTFYAYYTQIIREAATISPNAYVMLLTCPRELNTDEYSRFHPYNVAVRAIYESYKSTYNVVLVDLVEYASFFNAEVFTSDAWYSHYTAIGYEFMAEQLYKVLSLVIDNNHELFKYAALIPYKDAQTIYSIRSLVDLNVDTVSTAPSTYMNGKYKSFTIGSTVYFYGVFVAVKAVSSGLNSLMPDLPAPQDNSIVFFEYDVGDNILNTYFSYTTGWRHNGPLSIGDIVYVYGSYTAESAQSNSLSAPASLDVVDTQQEDM